VKAVFTVFSVACVVGSCHGTTEVKAVFTVLVLNTYLQDVGSCHGTTEVKAVFTVLVLNTYLQVVGSCHGTTEVKAVFTVLVLNTYLQDATTFCYHSGIWVPGYPSGSKKLPGYLGSRGHPSDKN